MKTIPPDQRPITLEDLAVMLPKMTAVDGHARHTDDDLDTWLDAARMGRWTRAQMAAAVLEVNAEFTGYRIQPGHVTAKIAEQAARIRNRWYCPDPPRELADDPVAEIAWRSRSAADYRERALYALATRQPLEEVSLLREPEPEVPSLERRRERIEQITREIGAAKAMPDAEPEAPVVPQRRAPMDPQRMADARTELETVRRNAPTETAEPA